MPTINYKLDIELPMVISDHAAVSYTESIIHWPYLIASSASLAQPGMGGVTTIDFLYVKCDQAITVTLNDVAGTAITVDADKPMVLTGTAITDYWITHTSATAASVYIIGLGA